MYYDSLAVFACYLSSGVAAAIIFLIIILIALRLGLRSPKGIPCGVTDSLRQVERLQFLTVVGSFVIIFQLLVTAIYCTNSANRMIVGVLVEKTHVTDALVARLSHIVQMGLFGVWITAILSLVNLSLIIFLRRRRIRLNQCISGSTPS
jgi:hypothetical protein